MPKLMGGKKYFLSYSYIYILYMSNFIIKHFHFDAHFVTRLIYFLICHSMSLFCQETDSDV